MKQWRKKFEWMMYARCADSTVHIEEFDSEESQQDFSEAVEICAGCLVRVECIKWALENNFCSVVVAGVYIPDPANKKEVRAAHAELKDILSVESSLDREI